MPPFDPGSVPAKPTLFEFGGAACSGADNEDAGEAATVAAVAADEAEGEQASVAPAVLAALAAEDEVAADGEELVALALALPELAGEDRLDLSFVGGAPIQNDWPSLQDTPTQTEESQALSKNLKKRGFKFVGPVIVYAFMQAVGMVNDHETGCPRHGVVKAMGR